MDKEGYAQNGQEELHGCLYSCHLIFCIYKPLPYSKPALRWPHLVACSGHDPAAVRHAAAGLPLHRRPRLLQVNGAAERIWPLQHAAACALYRPKLNDRVQPIGRIYELCCAGQLATWR